MRRRGWAVLALVVALAGCADDGVPLWQGAMRPGAAAASRPATVGALATCAGFYGSIGEWGLARLFRRAALEVAPRHGYPQAQVERMRARSLEWGVNPQSPNGRRLRQTCDDIRRVAIS